MPSRVDPPKALPKIKSVSIKPDFAALEALPIRKKGVKHDFTPDEDKAILKYWPTRDHLEVARILGLSRSTIEKRWRELATK